MNPLASKGPMRNQNFAFAAALGLSLLGYSGIARAEADTFGLGTGRDGAKTAAVLAGEVINTYAQATTALAAGGKTVTVGARTGAAANFTVGQVVMVVQSHDGFAAAPVSGSGASLDLAGTKVGRYELARVAAVNGNDVTFTHGVVNAFDANSTQLVSIPEYTTVTVAVGAKILARPWDGTTGGIVAFLATGAITSAGVDLCGWHRVSRRRLHQLRQPGPARMRGARRHSQPRHGGRRWRSQRRGPRRNGVLDVGDVRGGESAPLCARQRRQRRRRR